MKLRLAITSCFLLLISDFLFACQCPLTTLSLDECNKYDIIFRGRIDSLSLNDMKKGEAVFEILELYKGVTAPSFNILFDPGAECAQVFNVGEEWIIYTNYKQVNNAKMDWCSRSRKYFKNDKLDFYTSTYGNDYDDELKFLREKLGLHKTLKATENNKADWQGNKLPTQTEFIVYLLISIAGVIVFYFLFNKFFK